MKKNYYTPLVTLILYTLMYGLLIPGLLVYVAYYSESTSEKITAILFLIIEFILFLRRVTYKVTLDATEISDGSFLNKRRVLPVSSVEKIVNHKMGLFDGYWFATEGRRKFYFISTLYSNFPRYAINPKIIKDLKQIKPSIEYHE